MPKPVWLKRILRVLGNKGFYFVSQNGSHMKYRRNGRSAFNVIVPVHGREVPHGTFRSILRQSGLSQENFVE
ncbi:type II toxin-antitoxin system HicA family toxin [Candidatus Uhrbacteria bacterium]|nr:type II toxin-antitoxin system HicA family toxin [Candidatus Uhrbacteria bacterium]